MVPGAGWGSQRVKGQSHQGTWLIVASSISYVTSTDLLVWVPRIRHCRLTGQVNDMARDADIPSTVLTHVEQIAAVTPITPAVPGQGVSASMQLGVNQLNDRNQTGAGARPETSGIVPGLPGNPGRPFGVSGLSSRPASTAVHHIAPYAYMGPLRFLCASDAQVDMLVDSFMFWMDTVEMVRVAGHPLVFYSGWVFPIYIFCYLSCLRVVVMPQNPLLSSLRVALQDLPFFFVCVGLIAIFGFVTPILYLMKNLLVCLAFVYFNLMTKLKVFNTKRMLF
uniref:transmembrane protein 236-like n=1 Tax=Monopterus albus TaxID=43700 RepID=UPI0009B3F50C|nr:transmembrane protein 236-like [Monopterus albus]